MAKKGRIERNNRVLSTVQKDLEKRQTLVAILKSQSTSYDEKFSAMVALQKISRDGSKTRYRNRCAITGRSRGYYSKFGLSISNAKIAIEHFKLGTQLHEPINAQKEKQEFIKYS